jgi:hypothetical protein
MPNFTVRVSPKLKANKGDGFITESLLRFDQQPIRFPERLGPNPKFLEWHARQFRFIP